MISPPRPPRPFSSDPDVSKVEREKHASRLLRALMDALSASGAELAGATGTSARQVRRWADPDAKGTLPLSVQLGLPDDARIYLAAALLDGTDHEVARSVGGDDCGAVSDFRRVLHAQREANDAVTCAMDVMEDGLVTRGEGVKLERECNEGIRALIGLRERARLAQREGVMATTGFDA